LPSGKTGAVHTPFGTQVEFLRPTQAAPEDKGWIGERYDADAGLQYLNARYYDPRLGIFLQPDWFEVTAAGVGTNRYSYSFNDPVNMSDPGGNIAVYGGDDGHLIGNVDYGDPGWDELQGGRDYGDPTATDWAELNNSI
jgi:RHS repeat-associated protein